MYWCLFNNGPDTSTEITSNYTYTFTTPCKKVFVFIHYDVHDSLSIRKLLKKKKNVETKNKKINWVTFQKVKIGLSSCHNLFYIKQTSLA